MSVSTTCGSNCLPDSFLSSAIAAATGMALRYGRSVVIALKASHRCDDPSADRDLLTGQPVWISASVPALVVGANHNARLFQHSPDALKHAFALDRVGTHDVHLFIREPAGLVDDLVGHGDLPHVVQQRAKLEVPKLGVIKAESFAE